ncbi:hypothetical protein ACN47E_005497 [Coniothyrium glycines]
MSTVAVIGLGPAGLVALKNLKQEGFEVAGFDRHDYVGGLWQYSARDETSVTETTVVNISKERGCFSDFPYPDDVPSYPTAAQVQQYLVAYAEHYHLMPHLRLSTTVGSIIYDDGRQKWVLHLPDRSDQLFDRVVIAIGGMVSAAHVPVIEGIDRFKGLTLHSQAFKQPHNYAGKRVMVVGFSNSAADTATSLTGVADKVYLAHRHGSRILPRGYDGAPIDHTLSIRLFQIQCLIFRYFPRFGERFFDKFIKNLQDKSFKLRPEWGFEPVGKIPIVSDTLVPYLEDGVIESVKGIKRILSATTVELEDGRQIEVDVLVWCTGYKADFGMVEARFDPTCRTPPASWTTASGSNNKSLFRLYHNVFSLEKPDSLAFLGNVHFAIGGFFIFDMASQAIAQVWKGASHLPSTAEMQAEVDRHHDWLGDHAQRSINVSPGTVDGGPWVKAMDNIAGTGTNEYLGYGWKGWWFWLTDNRFCRLVMGGIWSPHIHRVFDMGKRTAWSGARAAIEKVNEDVAANKRRQKTKFA